VRRREPTEEQRARAKERREKMRALADRISAMSEEERAALAAKIPVATIEGRLLSVFNCCFVVSQMETATVVGGFRQWRAAGRCVRKGERGLAIWVPIGNGKEEGEAEGGTEEGEGGGVRFVIGTVFDVTQTDPIQEHEALAS